jgi:hypothetical protein
MAIPPSASRSELRTATSTSNAPETAVVAKSPLSPNRLESAALTVETSANAAAKTRRAKFEWSAPGLVAGIVRAASAQEQDASHGKDESTGDRGRDHVRDDLTCEQRNDGADPQDGYQRRKRCPAHQRRCVGFRSGHTCQCDGDRGRRNNGAGDRSDEQSARLAHQAHRDIATEGYRRDNDGEKPDLERVEPAAGIDGSVRKEGQDDRGHRCRNDGRAQFDPSQATQQTMKHLPAGQDSCERGTAGRGDELVTDDRQCAESP